jgi:hypothetical protein
MEKNIRQLLKKKRRRKFRDGRSDGLSSEVVNRMLSVGYLCIAGLGQLP